MNEREIDLILSDRVRSCTASAQLPPGMEERLIGSIRRTRRIFRAKVMAFVALLSVGSILVMGLAGRTESPKNVGETSLIATTEGSESEETVVSGWMLFGFFRECFRSKSTRSIKRKEERE